METAWATEEAYSMVVPAVIFLEVKAGQMVAAELPSLKVPEVRLRVPVEVNWKPPSRKRLLPVTSPMVRVVAPAAAPRVAPAALLILSVL